MSETPRFGIDHMPRKPIDHERYIEPVLPVTPDILIDWNRTTEVQHNLAEWQENRQKGKLIAIVLCGDARVWIPEDVARRTASIRALGAGGDQELKGQFASIINQPGVNSVAYFGHYDGEKFSPKHAPTGCGITDAHGALQMLSGEEENGSSYKTYAKKDISHSDPVMQAVYSAQDALDLTDKWVAAVALDHRSGSTLPVGFFRHQDGYTSETGMNPRYLDMRRYNAGEIYKKGMPVISERQLERMPFELHEYLNNWQDSMDGVKAGYQARGIAYEDALKVQNPSIVSLSTDPRPLGIMYRLGPNTAFKLRVPRSTIQDEEFITPDRLQDVLNQAHYPISQNILHYNQPGAAFSNTHTLLIQTKDMAKSLKIADAAMTQPHIREWLDLPDDKHPHQIIVGEVHNGKVEQMEVYAQAA